MRAGAVTPATRRIRHGRTIAGHALNEGRGCNPGDTGGGGGTRGPSIGRSMRAGAVTPATPAEAAEQLYYDGRSMRAGAVTPATPGRALGRWEWSSRAQ